MLPSVMRRAEVYEALAQLLCSEEFGHVSPLKSKNLVRHGSGKETSLRKGWDAGAPAVESLGRVADPAITSRYFKIRGRCLFMKVPH